MKDEESFDVRGCIIVLSLFFVKMILCYIKNDGYV